MTKKDMRRPLVLVLLATLCMAVTWVAADSSLHFTGSSFKIVQFADMHYSNGASAPCVDVTLDERPCSDLNTTAFMSRVLDAEKPDLVVFTGDNLVGAARDAVAAVTAYSKPCVDRQIPWAIVFGNHDDEGRTSRADQMAIAMSLPYTVSETGPTDIDGIGNYVLRLMSNDSTRNLANLYFIDSGAYSNISDVNGYDWIRPSQLNWFNQKAAAIKAENGGVVRPAFSFFHIPLPEYEKVTDFVGEMNEGVYDSNLNSGYFTAAKGAGDVRAMFVGHDHVNAGCGTHYGIKLCYAGGVGYGAYGSKGWPRRSRVILFENDGEQAVTWLRLADAELSVAYDQELYGARRQS